MRFPLHGWIGLATLVGSQTALILQLDPLTTHFYSFIWWPYILLVDGLIYYRRGIQPDHEPTPGVFSADSLVGGDLGNL